MGEVDGGGEVSVREVRVGDRTVRIEDFSGRKGARMLRVLEHVSQRFPEIQSEWAKYTSTYEATHTVDLDRAYARTQLAPQPLMREEPLLDEARKPLTDEQGRPLVRRDPMLDSEGRVMVGPDPLGHLTTADWEASGNKLRQPRSPGVAEQVMAVLPLALDLAESEVARLLALFAMPNEEVKRRSADGKLWDELDAQGDALLDAPLDQLVELAVCAGETLQDQYRVKIRERLGERLAAAARLVGLKLPDAGGANSTTSASTTSPTSSTDSPQSTGGESDEPSTAPVGAGSSDSSGG